MPPPPLSAPPSDNGTELHPSTPPFPPPAPLQPPLGPENTNSKHLDLPPVVNGRLQYSNKQLKYRPFPADIDEVRDKLLKLEQPILLNSQQISDYWSHMSNVYQRSTHPAFGTNGAVIEGWECRNRRRFRSKENPRRGAGIRNRPSKESLLQDVEPCKVRIKLTSYTKHAKDPSPLCDTPGIFNCKCIPEWLYIQPTVILKNKDCQHTHGLAICDRFKRSNALMYACKLKVEERYKYPVVSKWMKEKYAFASELQFLSTQDIGNASKFWRAANKDVELRSKIEQETPQDARKDECIDAIEATSSVAQLKRALAEICSKVPGAVDIVRPFMEAPASNTEDESKILEGVGITIPWPGIPVRKPPQHTSDPSPAGFSQSQAPGQILPPLPHPQAPTVQHPLHVPEHLVARYVETQNRPPQTPSTSLSFSDWQHAHRPPIPNSAPAISSDLNATSRDFMVAASTQSPYRAPYPSVAQHARPPVDYPTPSQISNLNHGSVPPRQPLGNGFRFNNVASRPPLGNGFHFDRPSWAIPQKRKADPPSTETAAKRSNTTDDIVTQLQKELQA